MLTQLFFANVHFAVTVFSALVFFVTAWLFLEAWKLDKEKKSTLVKSLGFFLLVFVSMSHATSLNLPQLNFFTQLIKILGLFLIIIGLIREPLLHPPKKEKLRLFFPFAPLTAFLMPLSTLLFLLIASTYWQKSTEGYEKQVKPASFAFLALAAAELLNFLFYWADKNIVFWERMLADFGDIWILSHIFELIGIIILGVWAWGYFRYRTKAQLFLIFVTSSLVIFLVTTISFTYLLLKNIEKETLEHLKTDANVLHYAIERVQLESLADARTVAENSAVQQALLAEDSDELFQLSSEFMFAQNTNFLAITAPSGEVIMRAEDKENIGDSLAENPVIKNALEGNSGVTVISKEGIISPEIKISAAVPIFDPNTTESDRIIGTVLTGFSVDSAFVDGVKKATGLDVSIFGGNTRAATTFLAPDGKSRFVGTKETNEKILSKVLDKGEKFVGPAQILNQPYLAVYSPLKTVDNEIIGMLFVGKITTGLIDTTDRSIQLTFLVSVVLMIFSTIPAFIVSRYMNKNLRV